MRFESGYVKLHRKLKNSWLVRDPAALAIWVNLLMDANYLDGVKSIKFKGEIIRLKPGQLVTSPSEIGARLDMSRSTVQRKLKMLENWASIEQQMSNKGTLITICNWETYQGTDSVDRTSDEHQASNRRTSDEHQVGTKWALNEEGKKERNKEKEEGIYIDASAPRPPNPNQLVELWNTHASLKLPRVLACRSGSQRWILAKTRLVEHPDLDYWRKIIDKINDSPFCLGENDRNWPANFDWFIRPDTHVRILEKKYDKPEGGLF